jgi:transposase
MTASSIRRRSAAWTILLDWTFQSRRRVSALWMINKTDRNDARGIAQMIRVGLYRPVHVKTLRSQKLRMLLTHRKLLQSKAIAIENDLRGSLRNFGLKVGIVGKVRFEARIQELVDTPTWRHWWNRC